MQSVLNRQDGTASNGDVLATMAAAVRPQREAAGLSQADLAALSGESRSTVRDIELGRNRNPTTIARVLTICIISALVLPEV